MDEIELKYELDKAGYNLLKKRFKASIDKTIDTISRVFVLSDSNIIRLREERQKGSKTYYLTYKQGKSRSSKVMLRIENDVEISTETYNGLLLLLPRYAFLYESTRHWWDGYDNEKYQLDQFRFADGPFYLYELEIEFENISSRAGIEIKAEALFKSLGIKYDKGITAKYNRYAAVLKGDSE